MSFTVEQKSLLTKLMASENLTVEHQKIHTAKFDPINRVLYLPIWQNMSGFMYDHLGGHEVGHALYTPADGWHDAAVDKTKDKNFKSFLNVVEDARIEKKVTRKFPGLKVSFRKGFQELLDRDFFGIHYKDVNKLAFIERLNLYTKSQYTADYIKFTTEEMVYVLKVQNLETWEDVLALTGEIYDYSKDEQFDMQMENQMRDFEMLNSDIDGNFDESDSDYEYSDEEDEDAEPQQSDKSKKSDEKSEEQKEESKSSADDVEDDETEESENEPVSEIDRYKKSVESERDQFSPECKTDDTYRQNENSLLDAKCKPYLYVDVPTVDPKNVFTSSKRVQELMSINFAEQIEGGYFDNAYVQQLVSEFKNKNDRYIGLLAKEFEMRKAAKAFSKSKLSDTGDIDINKLSSYKFDDNIFRKVMLTPKGKSHGLVLLLDCSGSMSDNMEGSIEQILVLTMFCRKVNIPFRVFGFTDCAGTYQLDRGLNPINDEIKHNSFSHKVGELAFSNVQLREYLNSKMSNAVFTKSLRNMILLKKSYSTKSYQNRVRRPASENLSNTPLVQAIFAVGSIMDNFRKSNNIDLTSLVIVHDGDSDSSSYYNIENVQTNYLGEVKKYIHAYSFDLRAYNVVVRDRKNKFEYAMTQNSNKNYSNYTNEELLRAALEWVRVVGKSKVFGFFILASRAGHVKNAIRNRYHFEDGKTLAEMRNANSFNFYETEKNLLKKFKDEKFLISNTTGYNSFYLISGGSDLQTENEELEIAGTVTSNKLKNAFMKMTKKKQVNRVLVSKFIQGMAV